MPNNEDRAQKGEKALILLSTLYDNGDLNADLIDALTDIIHARGPDMVSLCYQAAAQHYEEER